MILPQDIRLLQQDKDPWLSMTNYNMEYLSDSEQNIEGFDFNSNSNTDSNCTSTNYNKITINNNNIKISELPLLSPASPQDFWGPPSIDTIYSDEQAKTPFTHSNIESEDEEIMCLNDNNNYDTPPLDFEEDIIRYSKLAESDQQKIIKCYEEEKPLPTIFEDDDIYGVKDSNEDEEIIDDAVFPKAEFSSQDPANMVIIPTTIIATTTNTVTTTCPNSQGETDTSSTNIKEEPMVEDTKNSYNIKEMPRAALTKLKIPKITSNIFENNVVDTPEIIDQALDLEKDFDLIAYISNPESTTTFEIVKQEPEDITPAPSTSSSRPKRKSTISREQLHDILQAPQPKRRYSTRTRASSPSTISEYINPSSVTSNASSDDSYRTPKRRGRPAKPVASLLDLNEFAHLSPEDLRYRELRNKNNEASRRSRQNRRSKEQQLEDEANELTQRYKFMEIEVKKLEKLCLKYREKVKEMALL